MVIYRGFFYIIKIIGVFMASKKKPSTVPEPKPVEMVKSVKKGKMDKPKLRKLSED